MKKIFSLALLLLATTTQLLAAPQFVVFNQQENVLPIHELPLCLSAKEHSCVTRALNAFQKDMQQVTGHQPNIITALPKDYPASAIVVGTVGSNSLIDSWVKKGLLNDLKGKTEKYIIKTIDNQLVIAGSDKRGTVFGIYELSQQIGVSPWYYWADVPIEKHGQLFVKRGEYTDGEPAVRYRGIFLNDEAPCLTSWVKNTFGTNYGDHRFYEKVFELILRLKGNFLWPAMWSWAFYADDPLNSKTADEMGIIIGTSHHEPMARNHQEYARKRKEWGAWNYQTNQQKLDQFFREGIERMKGTDDIVTIGMRGDGDEAMSEEADTKLLQRVVENQRNIIKKVTGKPANKTPQVWALYKEVLDYYDKGMRVPDDVLILLCDDNWGNVRRVPNAKERKHPGGWGLYYHVDYVGAPRNTKWLNVTPTQNMWEQLSLAYDYGIERMWILNVGDLKPMEYPITMFMDMAWKPREFQANNITDHTLRFCEQQFGKEQAAEAARILNLCNKYAGRSTAEMLDAKTYNVKTGEWKQVADEYMRLEAEALRQYLTLPQQYRDAYQQIILFPIQAMSNVHQMYYAQAMNLALAAQNNPDANFWAERVREAFVRDSLLCAAYNHDFANGKWNGMMTQKHIGYTSWNDNFPADRMPMVRKVENGNGGYSFTEKNGMVVMEAEHYHTATSTDQTSWTVIPYMGRTRSGLALMPYTQQTGNAALTYQFSLNGKQPESVKVYVVVKSTLDYLNKGGLAFTVSLDNGEPQRVVFNDRLNEAKENIYSIFYPTVARRVIETSRTFSLPHQDVHTLTIHPEDPAIVFEKIVIDAGGYQPSFLYGDESPCKR
ncbi:MAG: glycosyl hydrolase 115 family protein [Prevotella sp.]|nr:glycosyl hydrolase 115 family protein [Prevotella sp.]